MKPIILQNNLYAFNTYLLIEKLFSLMKNFFAKKTELKNTVWGGTVDTLIFLLDRNRNEN